MWYVSSGGNDANTGIDPAKPLASVPAALKRISSIYRNGKWKAGESAVIVISGTVTGPDTAGPGGFSLVDISGAGNYPPLILQGDPVKGGVLNAGKNPGGNGRVLYIANNKVTLGDNLTLTGGCTLWGGAVLVGINKSNSAGEFVMAGGEISGNAGGNGGGVLVYEGSMTMTGGTIKNNTNEFNHNGGSGSGIFLMGNTSFTMSGGTIKNNGGAKTLNGGGVVVDGPTQFTMTGGEILGNASTNHGGGVYVSAFGVFTLSGGTVGNNSSGDGGGIYVSPYSTGFTQSGGTVGGNTPNNIKDK